MPIGELPLSLVELLRIRAERTPLLAVHTFLTDGERPDGVLTCRALDHRARSIAGMLQRHGLAGRPVLLLYPPGLEFIEGFFGCLYAGAIAVPAYPPKANRSFGRLSAILRDAGAAGVLSVDSLLEDIRHRLEQTEAHRSCRWLATDTMGDEADSWQNPRAGPDTLAFLQYTSGSTGDPKGVMVSHGNILHNAEGIRLANGLSADSIGVCWLPSFHDMGLISGVVEPVYSGFANYLMAPAAFLQRPARWLHAISRYRATFSGGPNSAYELCVRMISSQQRDRLDLSSWTSAFNGAEPVRAETLTRFAKTFGAYGFRSASFLPAYGMAEATLMISCGPLGAGSRMLDVRSSELQRHKVVAANTDDADRVKLIGCGQVTAGLEVLAVHPERGTRCGDGEIGELWVRGPSVAQGYWGRSEQTAATFHARLSDSGDGPFLRTGDLGYVAGGWVYVTGRLKDLMIIAGRNFYPQDIEATVEQCHAALNPGTAAAFSIEVSGEERLVVAVEVQRQARRSVNADEIFAAIRRSVAEEHELPVQAIALLQPSTVPKTSSGKIQRRPCRQAFLQGELPTIASWQAPATDRWRVESGEWRHDSPPTCLHSPFSTLHSSHHVEQWLRAQVARRTGIVPAQVDAHEPFTAFGFGSLEAVTFAADFERYLGRPVPTTLVYDQPCIAAVVRWATAQNDDAASQVATTATREPIAIVGIGCRFPGARNPEQFRRVLCDGKDCIRRVPAGRFGPDGVLDDPRLAWGGFLDEVDGFDAEFFGLAPREVAHMDPQQRLLLEVAWETLEQAGVDPRQLAGSATGVFVGISGSDYLRLLAAHVKDLDAYVGTGNAGSIAANRLSYLLDLRGPSLSVDTACSSSLVAVHLACRSLRTGECRSALAGGVNLILAPEISRVFAQAGMLAADGRCKTFAAGADGYVRGEGCGMVLLKRLSDARADGDRILAVIRGSAVNQDGRSNGLTAPNGPAQEAVIRAALADAGVSPLALDYVEAHGTGTELGDPIELQALGAVLCRGRAGDRPLRVGSVKTNIGHLEAAAGIAGLIKLVLALEGREIPAHLHFAEPNPLVPWDGLGIRVATDRTEWSGEGCPRLAGVSSFGFGGTNAHVIVEEAPPAAVDTPSIERPVHVLALSARSEQALAARATEMAGHLRQDDSAALADVCYTATTGRTHFQHRLALVASTCHEAVAGLNAFAARQPCPAVFTGRIGRGTAPRIAFLFTGQGSQYAGMGRYLFETQPTFRETLLRCDAIFRECAGQSIIELIHAEPGSEAAALLDRTRYAQPALFAIEWALAQAWQSWGIQPAAVLGHSLGEYVAACVAGVFSVEDGVHLVAERARLMDEAPGRGTMVAVFAEQERVASLLDSDRLSIAAFNADREIVVSGDADSMDQFTRRLDRARVTWQPLRVSHAFHSPLMEPILPAFRAAADRVRFVSPQFPLASNLLGAIVDDGEVGRADYWVRHVREPVRFADGIRALVADGTTTFVEVGPQPVLSALGQRAVGRDDLLWLPSLRRGADEWKTLAGSVAQLYAAGARIDWAGFQCDCDPPTGERRRRKVSLPTYPFQRQRYWFEPGEAKPETALASDSDQWFHEVRWQPAAHQATVVSASFMDGTLAQAVRPFFREMIGERIPPDEDRLLAEVEDLCTEYAAATLVELGLKFVPGAEIDAKALALRLGVEVRHERLLARLLEMLAEAGVLNRTATGWRVRRVPSPAPAERIAAIKADHRGSSVLIDLLEQCAGRLADVMRGRVDPLQLLFPRDSGVSAERLYGDAPAAGVLNALAGEWVRRAVEKAPAGRIVRILEIGAGTGGTTAGVLPRLPAERVAYTFTDVSSFFVNAARQRFREFPFVEYATLDIAADPAGQGFVPGGYDLVLAANVLHATPDLRESLGHVRKLLAPGGSLVLLEGTEVRRFLDLTFGLLEGWWAFRDTDIRPSHPLLSLERWSSLLNACGFAEAAILPGDDEQAAGLAGQRIIVSQSACQPPVEQPRSRLDGVWLICRDRGGFGHQLLQRLAVRGAECLEVEDPSRLCTLIDNRPIEGIVFLGALDEPEGGREEARLLRQATELVRNAATTRARVWFVTRGGQWVAGESGPVNPGQASLWGLGQVVGLEHPDLWGGMIDLDPAGGSQQAEALAEVLARPGSETRFAIRDNLMMLPRLHRTAATDARLELDPRGVYLITGGLGGAGLATARWLVRSGARYVSLMGRRGLPPRESWDSIGPEDDRCRRVQAVRELERLGADVRIVAADVADRAALSQALDEIRREGRPLKGVIHAAGMPGSRRLLEMTDAELQAVLRPKITGGWNLHELTGADPLDFFVCFSSASSLLGADGQGHYAAANRGLDAIAAWRRRCGLPGLSISWGRWGSAGMLDAEAHARFAQVGLEPMDPDAAAGAMGRAINSGRSGMMIAAVDWGVFKPLYQARRPRPLLDPLGATVEPPAAAADETRTGSLDEEISAAPLHARRDLLAGAIEREVARVMGLPASRRLDRSAGFFELGMDSLMAVTLRGRLQGLLDRQLPKTLAFEHPSIDSLSEFLFREFYADNAVAKPQAESGPGPSVAPNEPIAIVGASCRFPGASDLESFWRLLRDGVDAVSEVPPDRWDLDAWYDPDPDAAGKMYDRHGGFITGVDRFDPQFFGIAPREAAVMDPQHRLLLEVSWEALENAGCAPASLKGSRTGVFVGATSSDYTEILAERSAPDAYYITGNSLNAAAGRVSYVLGLHGPSMVVDAACASSLVAVHLACRSLRSGECDRALAGGVNLILSPRGTVAACRSRMLSATGRCRTFDASADGFVRGEGCGVVVLRRLSDAVAAGDPVLAVIRGTAVGQDGASGGLTVPNASAQQEVIGRALADANAAPGQIDYIEAHGTGTSLGDPIEVRALGAVFGGSREPGRPLVLGSVKTNVGHLEAASGVAGLIKAVLALRHERIPAHLHLRELNPAIDLGAIPAAVADGATSWVRGDRPRRAGVSAFGGSGTLAHVVIEEAPRLPIDTPAVDRPLHVLAISARTEAALRELAGQWRKRLGERNDVRLADLCFTANAGRSHFEHRRALVADDLDELARQLDDPGTSCGEVDRSAVVRIAFAVDELAPANLGDALRLYDTSPTFRVAIDRCENAFHQAGRSLVAFFDSLTRIPAELERPVSIALQWSLAQLWRCWGITPAAVWEPGGPGPAAACVAEMAEIEQHLHALLGGKSNGRHRGSKSATVELLGGPAPAWPDPNLVVSLATLDWPGLLRQLARLYVRGASVDWAGFDRDYARRKVALPTYPFQRQRCWVDAAASGPTKPASSDRQVSTHGLAGRRLSLAGSDRVRYETRVRTDRPSWLNDHRIGGRVVMPATAYLEMALQAAADRTAGAIVLEHVSFSRPLVLSESETCTLQTVVTPGGEGGSTFAIFSRPGEESTNGHWTQHVSGTIAAGQPPLASARLDDVRRDCREPVRVDSLYRALRARGLEFGRKFQGIQALWKSAGGALGHVRVADTADQAYRLHPALLDACSQVVAAALTPAVDVFELYMLVGLDRLVCHRSAGAEVFCHARPAAGPASDGDVYRADLTIYDADGGIVATISGLAYQRIRAAGVSHATDGNGEAAPLSRRIQTAQAGERLTMIETHVRECVARILGLSGPPDLRTGFFDLGMDSLSAAELISTLNRDLGRSLPATVLFEHGSCGALARHLLEEVSSAASEDVGQADANGNGDGNRNGNRDGGGIGPGNAHPEPSLDALTTGEMADLFARMLSDLKGSEP